MRGYRRPADRWLRRLLSGLHPVLKLDRDDGEGAHRALRSVAIPHRARGPGPGHPRLGADHWAANRDQRTCYYDQGRGFWFFFKEYTRAKEGKQIRFSPFALIWRSRGKENLNTIMADEAYIDFDRSFDLTPSNGEPPRVVHAMIEGEVRIRDDKGTGELPGDDLLIGPLTHIEYNENEHKLHTTSFVNLREKDLIASATGLTIQLTPSPPPADRPNSRSNGYSGARTVWLHKDIEITVQDVGRTGMVPGGRPSETARPGSLTADGPAQIDLPEARPANAPPGPSRPIIAQFFKNVRVRQGDHQLPEQLDADLLRLTLVPDESKSKPLTAKVDPEAQDLQTPTKPVEDDGRLSRMTLKLAEATGHAVWLQAPGQGLKARGNELRYERRAPNSPDLVYFRGDSYTWIEKESIPTTGPEAGKIQSVDTIRTKDVTILQALKAGDPATIIARGPGQMETRKAKGQPVERSASWNDRLELEMVQTQIGPRRRVTLKGAPKLASPTQGTIEATERIVAFLKEKPPKPEVPGGQLATGDPAVRPTAFPAQNEATAPVSVSGEAFQIDWMEADGEVLMVAVPADPKPGAKPSPARNLKARRKLNVVFVEPEEDPSQGTPDPASSPTAETAATRILPTRETAPDGGPRLEPLAVEEARAAEAAKQSEAAQSVKPAEPPGPPLSVEADEVWAKVSLGSATAKPDLEEVQLVRKVHLHQDPAPGKKRGMDATGNLVIFQNRGPDQAWIEAQGTLEAPARAVTDTFTIEGPRIVFDQGASFAQVIGPGSLTQEPPTPEAPAEVIPTAAFVDENGQAVEAKPEKAVPDVKGPVQISWLKEMKFYGQPIDPSGQPGPAWALFLGDVRAWTNDPTDGTVSTLRSARMRALLDGPVNFRQNAGKEPSETDPASSSRPRPEILLLHCQEEVQLSHRQLDLKSGQLLQKGQVSTPDLWYNVKSGQFEGKGAGIVRFYQLPGSGKSMLQGAGTAAPGASRPAATPAPRPAAGGSPRLPASTLPTPGAGASLSRDGLIRTVAARPAADQPRGTTRNTTRTVSAPATPQLEMSRIEYRKGVEGRLSADKQQSPNTPFIARFRGSVQVLHANVANENQDVSLDKMPPGFLFMAAEMLDVVREMPTSGEAAEAQFFIDAKGGRPMGRDAQKSISGDRITYDSLKQLVYVYGEENGVTIVNQDSVGQPFSASRGRAVMYNRKDGQIRYIEPQNFLLIDPRSGIKARPVAPGQPRDVQTPKPPKPIRRTLPSDRERKGFTGR